MGYRGQTGGGSHRGSGQKFQRTQHDKAKRKEQKSRSNSRQSLEETPELSTEELAEKTFGSLNKLGTQIFALSPFSQYYDDWLVSLRQVVAEFESDPAVAADEAFAKERLQTFTDVERALAELRLKEAQMEQTARTLSDTNHLLVDADAEYAHQTHELSAKRNGDIERLTKNTHGFEEELDRVRKMRTSFFGFTKKAKTKKEAEANQKLTAAKAELEVAVQNFDVEQEKLHDEYEKKKQGLMEKIRELEKQIANIESDSSAEVRQATCNTLTSVVKASLQRKPVPEKQ
jgi:hypothetical protein